MGIPEAACSWLALAFAGPWMAFITPNHTHTFTAMDSVSVPLLLPQPPFLCDSPSCSQAWQGCPRYTPGSAGPSLPFPHRDNLFIRYLNIVVQYPVQGWGDGGFTCF